MSESASADVAAVTKRPNIIKRLYLWVLHWAETPYGTPALFVLSFAESSFFPIPPDVLQIALSISKPKRSFYYAAVSMVASVLGAILGWYIGYALWAGFLESFFLDYVPGVNRESIALVQGKYAEWGFLAILVAAFTPIPYKVFTITAGMGATISLPVLIGASVLGRSARFFTVATCIFFFGPTVKHYIDKYFDWAMILFAVLLIGGFLLIKFIPH
ncbi:MAG: DedA family protein [Planctomycetaceae bacterium]|jgi:membrane protein YqaA with SNARE-associated domain|nr:DedA family protein [Planctomycetaceae bacterium]